MTGDTVVKGKVYSSDVKAMWLSRGAPIKIESVGPRWVRYRYLVPDWEYGTEPTLKYSWSKRVRAHHRGAFDTFNWVECPDPATPVSSTSGGHTPNV